MEEAREREMEAQRLQEELEMARIQMEENKRALEEALTAPAPRVVVIEHETASEDDDKTSEQSKCYFLSNCRFVMYALRILLLLNFIEKKLSSM